MPSPSWAAVAHAGVAVSAAGAAPVPRHPPRARRLRRHPRPGRPRPAARGWRRSGWAGSGHRVAGSRGAPRGVGTIRDDDPVAPCACAVACPATGWQPGATAHRNRTGNPWTRLSAHDHDGAMTTTRPVSAPALQRPDGSPVRVLVVDDEPNLTELLSMALRYEGWEVRTAASGLAAVRSAQDFGPDAVVLDMMLPDFDGLEVLRRMRGDDPERAGAVPHREGRRRGPRRRAHRRRRRLRHQAVQPRGGRRAAARADAPHHGRRPTSQQLAARRGRPDHRRGQPRGHAAAATRSTSPPPSSSCCAT